MKILSLQHKHNSSVAFSDESEIKYILSKERFICILRTLLLLNFQYILNKIY